MRRLLIWCALAFPALAGADPAPGWRVHVDVQMVSLPLPVARRLAPELRRPETFAAADAKVQALLRSGEAVLLGWPMTDGLAGEGLTTESIIETRFPTEFDAPTLPSIFTRNDLPPTSPSSGLVAPTSFETRNVGPVLGVNTEIEPGSRAMELSILVTYTRLAAIEPIVGARSERLEGRNIAVPHFLSWVANTSMEVRSGRGALLAEFVEGQSPPKIVFFLLHASAKPCPAASP